MRLIMLLALAATGVAPFGIASAASAEPSARPKAVIELFTSQGCSSCPPADKTLASLSAEPGIVTLAYHVDYWNYLGWADTLSSAENTARQYAYAKTFDARSVYTPQAVVNGREGMPGQDRSGLTSAVSRLAKSGDGLLVPIDAALKGDHIVIDVPKGKGDADIVVMTFRPNVMVDVERGENRGRKISYVNSVTGMAQAGHWSGQPVTLTTRVSSQPGDPVAYAVLLQESRKTGSAKEAPGAILGAAVIGAGAGL